MTKPNIQEVVPADRCYASDFKRVTLGEDEAVLFDAIAKLARIDARVVKRRQHEIVKADAIELVVDASDRYEVVKLARDAALFPPTAIIEFLNRELTRRGRVDRLVACRDESGEAVVLATRAETGELVTQGLALAAPSFD
jgi:hypothetical protein